MPKTSFITLLFAALIFSSFTLASLQSALGQTELEHDFNGDGFVDCHDLDFMTGTAKFVGAFVTSETVQFDLNNDFILTLKDIQIMLHIAANADPGITLLECELGDFNFDGLVDVEDFNYLEGCYIFFTNFGFGAWPPFYTHGDLNGDWVIDFADYWIMRENWTQGTAPDWPYGN